MGGEGAGWVFRGQTLLDKKISFVYLFGLGTLGTEFLSRDLIL